jgi:hypothetical protein
VREENVDGPCDIPFFAAIKLSKLTRFPISGGKDLSILLFKISSFKEIREKRGGERLLT